jgi:hypothetical protein
MNAMNMKGASPWWPAKRVRLKRRQQGFALYEAERRPGMPERIANAHARFEHEARQAMRQWLMV